MNREEASFILANIDRRVCDDELNEALDMAIKALKQMPVITTTGGGDLISREETLTAFADYVGSGMSMNDYDALWDIVAKMPAVKQEPKFIAKSDGTIEQIKNCNDCLFKKEWEKIGKLLSNILEKHTEQEPCDNAVSRQDVLDLAKKGVLVSNGNYESVCKAINELPSVNPQPCEDAIGRAEAIKIASGYCHPANVAKELAKLPPVNHTKTGHWIREKERHFLDTRTNENVEMKEATGKGYHTYINVQCSKCRKITIHDDSILYQYCPHCGAKMVEPQERSEKND